MIKIEIGLDLDKLASLLALLSGGPAPKPKETPAPTPTPKESPVPNAIVVEPEPPKKKPGRQPGFSPKAAAPKVEPPVAPAPATPAAPAFEGEDGPVTQHDLEVQAAVVAVSEAKGIDVALATLKQFGHVRAREILKSQKSAFIAHCERVAGAQ